MKKKLTFLIIFICLIRIVNAQVVTFRNVGYGKILTAIVTSPTEKLVGLENDIATQSQYVDTNKEIIIGATNKIGCYYLNFKFKSFNKIYQVIILPNGSEVKEINLATNLTVNPKLFERFIKIFTAQRMTAVLNKSFQQYIQGSAVSFPTTIMVCVAAGVTEVPGFYVKCVKGVATEGLAFGKEFILTVLQDAKGDFTQTEYETLRKIIKVSFDLPNSVINGDRQIIDTFLNDSKIDAELENVELSRKYAKDLYEKYYFIYELRKK